MTLTIGTGPLSDTAAGRFNFTPDPPGRVLFLDPLPYRVRAIIAGETVLDSDRASLLHEGGYLPVFYAPLDDFRSDLLEPSRTVTHCPFKGDAQYWSVRVGDRLVEDALWSYPEPIASASFLTSLGALSFDRVDRWLAEEAEVVGHAHDPYHRIDLYPTTRHVVVSLDGVVLAESREAVMLCEAGLPRRFYLPGESLSDAMREGTGRTTICAYKGIATYRSAQVGSTLVDDIAWSYADPEPGVEAIRDRWCFFDEKVDVDLDGVRQPRPRTRWS
jgi:uncharacterized protein (DUF427 family)